MAVNPLISLQTQTPNIAGTFQNVLTTLQGIESLKQAPMKNRLLQAQTQQAEAEAATGQQQAFDAATKSRVAGIAGMAQEALPALQSGDMAGARAAVLARVEQAQRAGLPMDEWQEAMTLLESDPATFMQRGQQAIDLYQRMNGEKEGMASAKTQIYKNGTIVQTMPDSTVRVQDPAGNLVTGDQRAQVLRQAYEDERSGMKTQEEINQIVELTRLKSLAGRDQEKRMLEMQSLMSQIEQGQLNLEEGRTQKAKASNLKNEALRLVQNLLDNQQGVKGLVGPLDTWTPTFLPQTLKARTDIEQLRNILTAENLGMMSGVLSESDIKILAGIAGGGLDISGDENRFIDELGRLKSTFMNQINQQVTTGQATATAQPTRQQPTVIDWNDL